MPRGFWLVGFAFVVAMLGTTLPTPLYPIYEHAFGISPLMVTLIFAVYALGVLLTLLWLGHLSDEIGRRPVLIGGLVLSGMSALVFLGADGIGPMFLGRVLSGLSAGVFTGTATAAMVDLAGEAKRKHAAMIAVAVNGGGLGIGTLLSGALADYAPAPLRLPFAIDLLLIALALAGMFAVPETVAGASRTFSLRLRKLRIPLEIRGTFLRAAVAGAGGFAVAGLLSAVAPLFFASILHVTNHIVAGAIVFFLFLWTGLGQLTVERIPPQRALATGAGALLAGVAILAGSIALFSLAGIFVAAAFVGYGQGIVMGFGLAQINERVRERRGEVSSTYFVLLYGGLTVPVIGAGVLSHAVGLTAGSLGLCLVVGLAVAGVLVGLLRAPRETAA